MKNTKISFGLAKFFTLLTSALSLAMVLNVFFVFSSNVSAATYSSSISTSGTLNLDVTSAGNGANITTDNVNIVSTCPAGYTVSIAATSSSNPSFNDTTLYKDGNKSNTGDTRKILSSTGTKDNPVSILGNNKKTWGYTAESNATINSNFIGLTNSQTILTTSSTGTTETGTTLPVYYGVSVDSTIEPGQYKMSDNAVITYYLTTSLDCTSYQVAFNPTSTAGGQTISGTGTMNNQRIAEGQTVNLDANAFTPPSGYSFKEWNTAADGSGTSYTDKQEVTDITTPGQTITLYAQWSKVAMLDTGQTVNQKLKRLANSSATSSTQDNTITALVRADSLPTGFTPTTNNTISTSTSTIPIYAWYDSTNTTIYYYSDATDIKMNQDSSNFFYNMRALADLSTISSWDTSKVTNMSRMFYSAGRSATTFTLDLSSWNTTSVTTMSAMFFYAGYNATTFTLDLSSWNTASVTTMSDMFFEAGYSATTFTLDLSSWNTASVTNMSYMFTAAGRNATTWSVGDLSSWDTSSVTNMSYMFQSAGYSATTWSIGDLSSWDTSSVTSMYQMFYSAGYSATTFTLDLSSWNTASVTNMSNMFSSAGYNATTWSVGDLSSWNTSSVTNMSGMFSSAGYKATTFTLDLSSWNTSSVTNMSGMFSSAGYKATTWSVTIPRTNGAVTSPIANTTSNLYGNSTSVTATPPSGKSFTLAN